MYPAKMDLSQDVIAPAISSHCILTLPGPPYSISPIFFLSLFV